MNLVAVYGLIDFYVIGLLVVVIVEIISNVVIELKVV